MPASLLLGDYLYPHYHGGLLIINRKENNIKAITSTAMCWQTVDHWPQVYFPSRINFFVF